MHRLATGATAALALGLAAALPTAPADAAVRQTGALRYVVHAGGCSGAVLNTSSGSWVMTAAHCRGVAQVTTYTGARFRVLHRYVYGSGATGDVQLLRVSGNVKRAVGGGFALGGTPARGSRINVYGYPMGRSSLAGCSNLAVSYVSGRYPQVRSCYLPDGTSGGPWFTSDVVLHGVVGGLDNGGNSNWTTNTVPFTPALRNWAYRHIS